MKNQRKACSTHQPICWSHWSYSTTRWGPPWRQLTSKCLNDYHPVALTTKAMKCFEKLVLSHIRTIIPSDKHQFEYRANRSIEDAITKTLHTALSHLEEPNSFVRRQFIDFRSAFNTVIPHKLVTVLMVHRLPHRPTTASQKWCLPILLLHRHPKVPQGWVLSPMLFTLFTHDCTPIDSSNSSIKFADDTTVVGLISDNEETAYNLEVEQLTGTANTSHMIKRHNKDSSSPGSLNRLSSHKNCCWTSTGAPLRASSLTALLYVMAAAQLPRERTSIVWWPSASLG